MGPSFPAFPAFLAVLLLVAAGVATGLLPALAASLGRKLAIL